MIDMLASGKSIKRHMVDKHYTVGKIARKLGVSEISVYKWRRGETLPCVDNLFELAQILDCKIDDLIIGI